MLKVEGITRRTFFINHPTEKLEVNNQNSLKPISKQDGVLEFLNKLHLESAGKFLGWLTTKNVSIKHIKVLGDQWKIPLPHPEESAQWQEPNSCMKAWSQFFQDAQHWQLCCGHGGWFCVEPRIYLLKSFEEPWLIRRNHQTVPRIKPNCLGVLALEWKLRAKMWTESTVLIPMSSSSCKNVILRICRRLFLPGLSK